MRSARITARYAAALQAIPTLGQLGVLAFGGWLAIEGRISLGVLLAFATYVVQLVAPVRLLAAVTATGQQARAGAHRVLELLAVQPAVGDAPDARAVTEPRGALDVDGVTFAYAKGRPVLDDVSFRVGRWSASPSSAARARASRRSPCCSPASTTSTAAPCASTATTSVRSRSTRCAARVGVVFEESFLFSTTIRETSPSPAPTPPTRRCGRAAALAHADGFIEQLPDGYDTVVGERGFTLSGGQRQRIALARAALANPKVLVLDDATSAIDARTEEAIHHSLRTSSPIAPRSSSPTVRRRCASPIAWCCSRTAGWSPTDRSTS